MEDITAQIDTLKERPVYAKADKSAYLARLGGMTFGDDPREGYFKENTFYHPELKFKFTYPAGWQFENSPLQVAMAPSDGKAMVLFTISKEKTLKAAADSAVSAYGLSIVDNRNVTVNGLPALATRCKQVSANQSTGVQSTNMLLSYFISYDNTIFVFHGVSAEADYASYSAAFENTMSSFARLTDASKINVKPKRVIVRTILKAGTLNDAFVSFGVKQSQMAELALLNNMELAEKVAVGKQVKIVGE